jgi:hypothetical protein
MNPCCNLQIYRSLHGKMKIHFQWLIFVHTLMKLQSLGSIEILTASSCCVVKKDDKIYSGEGDEGLRL